MAIYYLFGEPGLNKLLTCWGLNPIIMGVYFDERNAGEPNCWKTGKKVIIMIQFRNTLLSIGEICRTKSTTPMIEATLFVKRVLIRRRECVKLCLFSPMLFCPLLVSVEGILSSYFFSSAYENPPPIAPALTELYIGIDQ